MIMRLSLPSRPADSLLLCGLIPFNATQQKKKKRWVAIVLSPQWPLSTPTNCAAREGSRSYIYLFIFTMQMCKGIKRHRCTEITLQHSWSITTTPGTPVEMGFSSGISLCNLSAVFKSWQNEERLRQAPLETFYFVVLICHCGCRPPGGSHLLSRERATEFFLFFFCVFCLG